MSTYTPEVARLDAALDALGDNELVGDDRENINSARTLIRGVRDRLVGADHDEDRHQSPASNGARQKSTRSARKAPQQEVLA